MKELEKNVLCVLLQRLEERDLIPQTVHHRAREKVLGTWEAHGYFRNAEPAGETGTHG